MSNDNFLLVTSPVDNDNTNNTVLSISLALQEVGGSTKVDSYKYFKLIFDGQIISEYVHEENKPLRAYTFSNIDTAEYANSGFPLTIEVKAYTGKSLNSSFIVSNAVRIIIDTLKPRIVDLVPKNSAFVNDAKFPITAIIKDDGGSHIDRNSIQLKLNEELIENSLVQKTIVSNDIIQVEYTPKTPWAEKEHSYSISAKDMAGNTVKSPKTKFLVDTIAPEFKSIAPATLSMLNTLTPEFKAIVLKKGGAPLDLNSICVILDGQFYNEENAPTWLTTSQPVAEELEISFSPIGLTQGMHSAIFKIKDKAANEATSHEVIITLDISPPAIDLMSPTPDSILASNAPIISAVVADGGGSLLDQNTINIVLDGSAMEPSLKPAAAAMPHNEQFEIELQTANLADGPHTYYVTATDKAGNKTATTEQHFVVDTNPPVVQSVFPNGVLEKSTLALPVSVELSDAHSGIDPQKCSAVITTANNTQHELQPKASQIAGPGSDCKIQFGPLEHIGLLGIGKHQLTLQLQDIAGNTSQQTVGFEIQHAMPFENNSFQVIHSFTDSQNNITDQPYLLPPDFVYGEDLILEIHGVVANSSTWKSEAENIEASIKKGENNLKVKIPADSAWTTDTDVRSSFRQNFEQILKNIEEKEGDLLRSGAAHTVRTRTGRAIPLSASEILPWNCGVDREARAVPLLPGFRLRMNGASFQYCGPGRDEMNGMVPAGEVILPVASLRQNDGALVTVLDPMASGLSQAGYTTSETSFDGMIGSPADLYHGDLRRKYLAIVLPATLASSASASPVLEEHAALVAADRFTSLFEGIGAATGEYSESAEFVIRRFRGRTGVVVELPIVINGEKKYVPVGSTLRQISERRLHWFSPDLTQTGQIKWMRQWSTMDGNGPLIEMASAQWVDLGLKPLNSSIDFGDLPVLPGDHIEFRLG